MLSGVNILNKSRQCNVTHTFKTSALELLVYLGSRSPPIVSSFTFYSLLTCRVHVCKEVLNAHVITLSTLVLIMPIGGRIANTHKARKSTNVFIAVHIMPTVCLTPCTMRASFFCQGQPMF